MIWEVAREVRYGLDFLMNSHSKLVSNLLLAHLVLCTLCESPQDKGRLDFLGAGEEAVSAPPLQQRFGRAVHWPTWDDR